MALTYPWLGLLLLVAVVIVAGVAWFSPQRASRSVSDRSMLLAHADRVRRLPRFQALARHRLRWLVIEALCVGLATLGGVLLAARPVDTASASSDQKARDIVLCLDVSGSMADIDRDVINSYLDLAGRLDGERIGFVLFDSSAVTVFPLTDDAAYIRKHLQETAEVIGTMPMPGTRVGDGGSSLIGDGLASCVQRFDHLESQRPRTIVFATDNQLAGKPIYSLQQAADLAAERKIMVYGITPGDNSVQATEDLRTQARSTGGDVLLLTPSRAADVGGIISAVDSQERATFAGPIRSNARDLLWPGCTLVLFGLAGAVLAELRRSAK